jgi:DNA uptake protein ComE-like DNA-binding protein
VNCSDFYGWGTKTMRADASSTAFQISNGTSVETKDQTGRRSCRFRKDLRVPGPAEGSILVGLLWCLALLSIVVIGVLHTARMDLLVGKNHGDRIQAHYLALAGIEKAKALLYEDARERSRGARNHSGNLYSAPEEFRDATFGRGQFTVFRRGRDDEGGGILYGISDEEARLNLNTASTNALAKLNGMTAEMVAAISDWRDGDNSASAGGAENEYYISLQPPYLARNGPFQTVRELLMVRGVSASLLLGSDVRQNGLLDSEDEDGRPVFIYERATDADLGWAGMFTVNSSVNNVNSAGENRVNVQEADESALAAVPGLSSDIARAIVSYRGQNQLQSLADLLDVTAGGSQTNRNTLRSGSNQGGSPSGSGNKVINEDLLMDIADDVTVESGNAQPGLININTASLDVLATLPGVDRQLAHAIVSHRQSSGFFPNVAWLLKVPDIDQNLFKQVAPLVSARSETFRILSEGRAGSAGVRQRIEVVVHLGLNEVTTLSYREDDL